jgi:hypothetical protein
MLEWFEAIHAGMAKTPKMRPVVTANDYSRSVQIRPYLSGGDEATRRFRAFTSCSSRRIEASKACCWPGDILEE